jgi:hypothetical protein
MYVRQQWCNGQQRIFTLTQLLTAHVCEAAMVQRTAAHYYTDTVLRGTHLELLVHRESCLGSAFVLLALLLHDCCRLAVSFRALFVLLQKSFLFTLKEKSSFDISSIEDTNMFVRRYRSCFVF